MLEAALWGLVTAGSLWVGAALAVYARPAEPLDRPGDGVRIGRADRGCRVRARLRGVRDRPRLAAVGFAAGALAFYVGDWAIDRRGGHGRKSTSGEHQLAGQRERDRPRHGPRRDSGVVRPRAPRFRRAACRSRSSSACSCRTSPSRSPGRAASEPQAGRRAASSRCGARRRRLGRRSRLPAGSCSTRCRAGGGSFALAFAGGALLVMLADTLMPEAFELGGREAGLVTALGFAFGFALS